MPRDSNGNYTLPPSNPVVTNTTIAAAGWANPTMADVGAEITNSLDRAGRGGMTGPFGIQDGALSAPGLRFTTDPNNGLRRSTTANWHLVSAGADVANISPATFTIPVGVTLNVLGSATGVLTVAAGDARYLSIANAAATYLSIANAAATYIPLSQKGAVNGVATLDGAGQVPLSQLANAGGGAMPTLQVFTASGTYTPTAGIKGAIVTVVGGGGAGGGVVSTGVPPNGAVGGPGGGGAMAIKRLTSAQIGGSQSVTVGAAGVGASGVAGGAGGTSSFGAFCSATGGAGGLSPAQSPSVVGSQGAAGGTATGGEINIPGNASGRQLTEATLSIQISGACAAGPLGGSATGTTLGSTPPAGAYGAGGSGQNSFGSAGAKVGSNGHAGVVIVQEFF